MKVAAPPRSRPPSLAAARTKPPFDPLAFLGRAGSGRTVANYAKDTTVFAQGEPADAVFYIQKGKVKITVVSAQGKEAVVAVLDADEFCGEGCLAGQPRRMATATAMTECEIMRLPKAAIVQVLHEETGLLRTVRLSPTGTQHPDRRGSRRPAVQFQREAPGARPSSAGEFRQGKPA